MIAVIEDTSLTLMCKRGRAYPENFTGIYILKSDDGNTILKRYVKDGKIHRLNGPGDICNNVGIFYIDGINIPALEYWNHPMVIKHKLAEILNEKN